MTKTKSPSRADLMKFHALKRAVEQDKLRIYLDYGKVNRPLSPVYDPWECLLPILVPTLIGLLLIICVGVIFGLLFIIGMIFVYTTYFKKKIYRRLIERTKRYLTSNYQNCQELWDFGGIVLVNAEDKAVGCVSPIGDWKDFVVLNYSDLMLDDDKAEKKEEVKEEKKDAKTNPKTR